MKKNIHPKYYPHAVISCACGASFEVGSTIKKIRVDICSQCHPFYTGKQKLVDTARRVEKFEAKVSKKSAVSSTRKGKTAKHTALKAKRTTKIAVRKTETKKLGTKRQTASSKKKPAKKAEKKDKK